MNGIISAAVDLVVYIRNGGRDINEVEDLASVLTNELNQNTEAQEQLSTMLGNPRVCAVKNRLPHIESCIDLDALASVQTAIIGTTIPSEMFLDDLFRARGAYAIARVIAEYSDKEIDIIVNALQEAYL